MNADLYKHLQHYFGIVCVVVALYFFVLAPFLKNQTDLAVLHGTHVTAVTESQPTNTATAAVGSLVNALKDKALADAISGRMVDLSAAQSTIAKTISAGTGLNAQLAGALAEGLTRPTPKVQVLTVDTSATSKLAAATPAPTDDNIKADLKDVLNDPSTNIHTTVETNVHVSYEDKPFSPIFAAYTGNESGIGYTFRKTQWVDLDGLALKTGDGFAGGIGVEHILKGTSAGIGLGALYDFSAHKPELRAFVAIHF